MLFDYLYIYSVLGVCQRNVQRSSLSAAYLVTGRLWLFALFRFDVSSSYLSYPLVRISAILGLFSFIISRHFIIQFTIYQGLVLIG